MTKSKEPKRATKPFELSVQIQRANGTETRNFTTETEEELESWFVAIQVSISPSFLKPAKE